MTASQSNFSFYLQIQLSERKKKDSLFFAGCFEVDANDSEVDVDTKIQRRVHRIGELELSKIIEFAAKNWLNNENEPAIYEDTFETKWKILTKRNRKEILKFFENPLKMSHRISFSPRPHLPQYGHTLFRCSHPIKYTLE